MERLTSPRKQDFLELVVSHSLTQILCLKIAERRSLLGSLLREITLPDTASSKFHKQKHSISCSPLPAALCIIHLPREICSCCSFSFPSSSSSVSSPSNVVVIHRSWGESRCDSRIGLIEDQYTHLHCDCRPWSQNLQVRNAWMPRPPNGLSSNSSHQ